MYTFLILIVPAMILGMWAQMRVQSSYGKWARVAARSGLTGREAALLVLQQAGIHNVEIVETGGQLTDHYDPHKKRLVLSRDNYRGRSVAALGIAAHEAGHAIQDATNYSMLQLRMSLVPVTSIASQFLPFVMLGGFFFYIPGLVTLGAVIYFILTIFQLVTLPVEFDASKRAKAALTSSGMIMQEEARGVNDVLDSAAWTYVAAFVSSLAHFIYLFLASRR